MPRSEREQRLLQEIEQALSTEDPRLARSIRSASATSAIGPPVEEWAPLSGDRGLCSSSGLSTPGVSSSRCGSEQDLLAVGTLEEDS
jgi:hypothetical protein